MKNAIQFFPHCWIWFWMGGVRVWIGRLTVYLAGPRDIPMFSERNGYRKPLIKIGKRRVFVELLKEEMRY